MFRRTAILLACHDGFGRSARRHAAYTTQFLERLLGSGTDVRPFAFYDASSEKIMAMTQHADFFYLAVGHEPEVAALFSECPNQGKDFRRRHHLEMFWASSGHVLGIIRISFGHHLDMFWTSFGHVLDIIQTSLGCFLTRRTSRSFEGLIGFGRLLAVFLDRARK